MLFRRWWQLRTASAIIRLYSKKLIFFFPFPMEISCHTHAESSMVTPVENHCSKVCRILQSADSLVLRSDVSNRLCVQSNYSNRFFSSEVVGFPDRHIPRHLFPIAAYAEIHGNPCLVVLATHLKSLGLLRLRPWTILLIRCWEIALYASSFITPGYRQLPVGYSFSISLTMPARCGQSFFVSSSFSDFPPLTHSRAC